MRNYDRVSKYIQAPDDFIKEGKKNGINSRESHYSQVIHLNLGTLREPSQSYA